MPSSFLKRMAEGGTNNATKNTPSSFLINKVNERKALNTYGDKISVPLTLQDGTSFGNVSYNAFEAIRYNRLDSYKPISNEESSVITKYRQYIKQNTPQKPAYTGEVVKGNDFWTGVKYTADQIGNAFTGAMKGIGNALRDIFAQQMEATKHDIVLNAAEANGMIKKGYNEGYSQIVDNQNSKIYSDVKKSGEDQQIRTQNLELKYPDLSESVRTVGKLVGSVGQAVPMMALSAVNPMLGTAALGTQVYGNSMAEALAGGADIYQARAYGGVEAIKEMSIERLFGGIPFTKGFVDDAVAPLANRVFKNRAVKEIAKWGFDKFGEGIEEVLADSISPYLKRAIYDPSAPNASFNDLAFSFAGGVVASSVLGSVGDISKVASYKGLNQKIDNYNASIEIIPEDIRPKALSKKTTTLEEYDAAAKGLIVTSKIVDSKNARAAVDSTVKYLENEISRLNKDNSVSPDEKNKLIQGFAAQINAYADYARDLDVEIGELTALQNGKADSQRAEKYLSSPIPLGNLNATHVDMAMGLSGNNGFVNIRQIEAGLYAVTSPDGKQTYKSQNEINNRYQQVQGNAVLEKLLNAAIQDSAQSKNIGINANVSLDENTKTFMEKLSKKANVNIAVKDVYNSQGAQMSRAEGYYDRATNTIVFAPESTKADIIKGVAMHEVTHAIEGSDFYEDYREFAINELYGNDTTRYMEAVNNVIRKYADENVKLDVDGAEKELVAEFTRNTLFNDEAAIDRLVSERPNLAVRIYRAIVEAIEKIKMYRTDKEGYGQLKNLETGRKLFEKALDNRGVDKKGEGIQYLSRKMGGYSPDVNVSTKGAAEQFGISNINDKKEVIKKVAAGLKATYLSTAEQSKPIKNIDTGMEIEIWKNGIKETFGNDKYYGNLTDELKLAKIATMKDLAKLIKYGEVRNAEAGNYHNAQSTATYAYLTAPITVDNVSYMVNMDIRKSQQHGNKFYIHSLEINTASQLDQGETPLNRLKDGSLNPILAQSDGKSNIFYQTSEKNSEPAKTDVQIALEKAGLNDSIFKDTENDTPDAKTSGEDTRQMSIKDEASTAGATPDAIEDAKREWAEKGTDSKYFRKWFGDSKVVDEDGKPLVVYHGTAKEFNAFDRSKIGENYFESRGGFFFTNKKQSAKNYAQLHSYGLNDKGKVLETYLSIKNPLMIYASDYYGAVDKFDINSGEYVREAEINGNDGIIAQAQTGESLYIAFSPNQIKSATDNIGTFDPNNPDIRYSVKDDNGEDPKRSQFYDNTITRATAIPQDIKDKLNPESFDFIPETSKEWQDKAVKNVNADLEGVKKKLEDAEAISGGVEAHEAAVITQKLIDEYKQSKSVEVLNKLRKWLSTVAEKTREAARALKATDTAWDKADSGAALVKAERTVQKANEQMKKDNPKAYGEAEAEKNMLNSRMRNAENEAAKQAKAQDVDPEVQQEIEKRRKKRILDNWVKESVPRAKQKNMFEKIREMYEVGVYDDQSIANLVSEKRGLPYLDLSEVKQIIEHMEKAKTFKEGSYEQRAEVSKAEKIVDSKIPVSVSEKIKGLTRTGALTGPKTFVRNIVGNIGFGGLEAVRENTVGSLVDWITSKSTGERTTKNNVIEDTKAFAKGAQRGFSEWWRDIKEGVDTSPTKTQYEIKRNSRTFKSGILNGIDAVVKKGLSLGDRPFYEGHFEKRIQELQRINKTNKVTEDMVIDAKTYALDKVFQNDSSIKAFVSGIKNAPQRISNDTARAFADFGMTVILPFTETPANIADKILDYSPVGIAKAAFELGKTKKGTFDQKRFVDTLSRGLTGLGMMLVGHVLASKGLLKGSSYGEEDEDKRKFDASIGEQDYALKIGNKWHSISWLNPAASMLLIGAEIKESSKDDAGLLEAMANGAKTGLDSFFEMSVLSGIKDVFSKESATEGLVGSLLGSSSLYMPMSSFLRSVNKVVDKYERETKDKNQLMSAYKKWAASIPGLSNTLPRKVDAFGNEMLKMQGNNNLFDVFINPAEVTKYDPTPVQEGILKVYDDTKSNGIFPDNITKPAIEYNKKGITLNDKAFEKFKKELGTRTYKEYEKLMNTEAYQNMTSEEKAEALMDIKGLVQNTVKFETIRDANGTLGKLLVQGDEIYNIKTKIELDKSYASYWAKIDPEDDESVVKANTLGNISNAMSAFEKAGNLTEENATSIMGYINEKKGLTNTDKEVAKLYRETGSEALFNGNGNGDKNGYITLLSFTYKNQEYVVNVPKDKFSEIIRDSDKLVRKAYESVISKGNWKYLNAEDKKEALLKAKNTIRQQYEDYLKKKYGVKLKGA